jgi:hypothetical protein
VRLIGVESIAAVPAREISMQIANVMRAYANDAVAYADDRLGIALDYSEQSLESVDRIVAESTKSGLLVPGDLSAAEREELWAFCKMLGGYVGEVIVRNLGGEWQTNEMDDGATTVKLVTAGVSGSPPEAVWRALTEPYQGIVSYYRGLRAILGHGEETIVNGIRTVRLPPLSAQPPGPEFRR